MKPYSLLRLELESHLRQSQPNGFVDDSRYGHEPVRGRCASDIGSAIIDTAHPKRSAKRDGLEGQG